jgi:hypothetical protein
MKILEFKNALSSINEIIILLPDGSFVPRHFHVTELGIISKDYIDCGGTIRHEKVANFQIWSADDLEHRINPQKIIDIIEIAEDSLGLGNLEIEIEFQAETIGKYGLELSEGKFLLSCTQTDCLAKDKCGIREQSETTQNTSSCCDPSSGCC